MQLKEFIDAQKAILDDFALQYDRRRKSKGLTLFRPEPEWQQLLTDYEACYGTQETQG